MRSRSANLIARSSEALLRCHRPDLIHRPGDGTLLRAADVWTRPNLQSPFRSMRSSINSAPRVAPGLAGRRRAGRALTGTSLQRMLKDLPAGDIVTVTRCNVA